jgi:hypothetical protein
MNAAANADPNTRCATCGNTLDQCGPSHDGLNANGTPCTWDAGHVVDGDPRYGYRHQCSHCNRKMGAVAGNQKRNEIRQPWP